MSRLDEIRERDSRAEAYIELETSVHDRRELLRLYDDLETAYNVRSDEVAGLAAQRDDLRRRLGLALSFGWVHKRETCALWNDTTARCTCGLDAVRREIES